MIFNLPDVVIIQRTLRISSTSKTLDMSVRPSLFVQTALLVFFSAAARARRIPPNFRSASARGYLNDFFSL